MNSPSWIEWFMDNGWEDSPASYKRWVFRIVIDPLDDFFCWWDRRVTQRWQSAKNAYLRVKQGYDWSNVWNMNDWFISGAVGILETWVEVYEADPETDFPMGTPCIIDEDGNEMSHEKWASILLEMLEGFKLWHDYEGSGHNWETVEEPTYANMIIGRDGRKVERSDNPDSSYWHDGAHFMKFDGKWKKCGLSFEEEDKYQRALDMFAKYHGALWD